MSAVTNETAGAEVNETSGRAAVRRAVRAQAPGTLAAQDLAASGALDGLFAQIDAGELDLTGDGGFIPALIKAALERGLGAELSGHLGYAKGAPEASEFANSRNGSSPKTVASQVGDVDLAVPRDRDGSFIPRLVPSLEISWVSQVVSRGLRWGLCPVIVAGG